MRLPESVKRALNRPNWKELAGQSVVQGNALATELEREQKRSATVLALLDDDSIDLRIRCARAKTILKLTANVRSREPTT